MRQLEHAEQCALLKWWRLQYPAKSRLLFAIPNGGARNAITGAMLKAEGVLAGVPDLFLAVPAGGRHGLFIELKRRQGGKVSQAQKDMLEALQGAGYMTAICRGWLEAKAVIQSYLAGHCPGR